MNLPRVELTANQDKLWKETRAALMWECPAFTHILYSMMEGKDAYFTDVIPVAATDGSALLLNPKTFFKYNMKERVFIIAHEIMHCIWNHCGLGYQFAKRGKIVYPDGTSLPYDAETMNVATDLVINDTLIESKVGLFNKDWLHDKAVATFMDSAIDAYKKVFKQQNGGEGRKPGDQPGPKGDRFDEHMKPGTSQGKDPQTAANERNDGQWKTEVAAGMAVAKARGKLPTQLERLFGEILDPKVDWREHLRAEVARKIGSGGYDWRSPDRRLIVRGIYSPARSGYGCRTVVVGGDTSGSIDYGVRGDGRQSTGDMFLAEMGGILEDLNPERVIVIWCDAAVGRVDELNEVGDLEELRRNPPPGGGGTRFLPVFDEIEKMGIEPDALVYLTDGYGLFPNAPPTYPVIWGSITPKGSVNYPFGEVVEIPKQAA